MNTINCDLLHDHAVIRFSGELTWESATELAKSIDTLTMRYFYKRIELVIGLPGRACRRSRAPGTVHLRLARAGACICVRA